MGKPAGKHERKRLHLYQACYGGLELLCFECYNHTKYAKTKIGYDKFHTKNKLYFFFSVLYKKIIVRMT